ncbi:MAG TPA: OmpA family protein [Polyangiaceae bacterium]|nr:OmpA family protein [Polyangiaceae bacterium]
MFMLRLRAMLLLVMVAGFAAAGCGHSEDEWQQAQRDIAKLKAEVDAANRRHSDDEQKYADAQQQIDDLKAKLKDLGVGLSRSEEEKSKLRQAMSEYEARLKQLDDMKARFRDLKSRLDQLTKVGLKVVVRNNRMVIQLPGDILFDSGKDTLKPEGKKILKQVADVIKGDATLSTRNFEVAGHTDKEPYAGTYFDNWGLSVMRARQVLTFLVAPDKGEIRGVPTGGGLDPLHLAAAGYGQMDPIAGTTQQQTRDEEQKNRRVELVLQPNVEEMLNLKDLAN